MRYDVGAETMTYSLYAAIVPSTLQMLGSVAHLLDKAAKHCADEGLPEAELLDARLADDMLPFAYQVKSCAVHSIGAIEGVRAGTFSPDTTVPPASFAALADRIEDARAGVQAVDPAEFEGFVGRDMAFVVGEVRRLEFTADQFLLSFTQPNLYFHVTTAYAILRARGVALGKRDYLGALRIKG